MDLDPKDCLRGLQLGRRTAPYVSAPEDFVYVPVKRIHTEVARFVSGLLASHGCYIAGGYARWACSPRDVPATTKDIDVICPSEQTQNSLVMALKARKWKKTTETEYSITFKGVDQGLHYPVQLLKRFRGETTRSCLRQFDLSICRVALITHDSGMADSRFAGDEAKQRLIVRHVRPGMGEALNVLHRLMRYSMKGYSVSQFELTKVVNVLRQMDDDAWKREQERAGGTS